MSTGDRRLDGGADRGASRRGDIVVRTAGPWTPAIQHLLGYLADQGFDQAPRPLGFDTGVEQVSFLPGETVGNRRPWPAWVHSDQALAQVADWLAAYHRAVADYRPPADAVWREVHAVPGPDVIVAHNDAAPYNAVWTAEPDPDARLVGFVDWDMAGPRHRLDDLAWTAFSWVPLHARRVVAAEGFTEFGRRGERLAAFLDAYGSDVAAEEIVSRLVDLITGQIELMHDRARSGDQSYRRMIMLGRADDLATARDELVDL